MTADEYGGTTAPFDFSTLDAEPATVRAALLRLGLTRFRVSYDGGSDEGFSHPKSLGDGATMSDVGEASTKLAKAGAAGVGTVASARAALDHLANLLATHLLGQGYGTGEISLWGVFVADLGSGVIRDIQDLDCPE